MKTKNLKVTAEIKQLINDGGKTKATVSLTIEGVFVVRGARLVDGSKGMFVSMPSRRTQDGEFYDICFPINNDTRLRILDAVVTAYEKALSERENAEDGGDTDDEPDTNEESA
jgi:stage V sporulation protein G